MIDEMIITKKGLHSKKLKIDITKKKRKKKIQAIVKMRKVD